MKKGMRLITAMFIFALLCGSFALTAYAKDLEPCRLCSGKGGCHCVSCGNAGEVLCGKCGGTDPRDCGKQRRRSVSAEEREVNDECFC